MTALISPLVGRAGSDLSRGSYGDVHCVDLDDEPLVVVVAAVVTAARCPPLPMLVACGERE